MFGLATIPHLPKFRRQGGITLIHRVRRSLRKDWRIIVKNELKTINQKGLLRPFKGCL
jgi:hypothetical protein